MGTPLTGIPCIPCLGLGLLPEKEGSRTVGDQVAVGRLACRLAMLQFTKAPDTTSLLKTNSTFDMS